MTLVPFRSNRGRPAEWTRAFRCIVGVMLPTCEHGAEVVPTVQRYHDQVSGDEQKKSTHRCKMPNPHQVEPPSMSASQGS